jgi:hypothetical protein
VTITIRLEGLDELRRRLSDLDVSMDKALDDAIEDQVLSTHVEVTTAIRTGPASGTTYYRMPGDKYMTVRAGSADGPPVAFIPGGGKKGISPVHTASAAGQAPMSDTGGLVKSIKIDIKPLTATVGSNLAYARYLEYGTRKIAPRPVWEPAAAKAAKEFRARVEARLEDALR